MATVHLGRLQGSAGFSRTVAVKRLHPQHAKDPEFVAMLPKPMRYMSRTGRFLSWRGSPRRVRRIRLRGNWTLGVILFFVLIALMFCAVLPWIAFWRSGKPPQAKPEGPRLLDTRVHVLRWTA